MYSLAMKCGSRENCSVPDYFFLLSKLFQWISKPFVWLLSHWSYLKFAEWPTWMCRWCNLLGSTSRGDNNSSCSDLNWFVISKWIYIFGKYFLHFSEIVFLVTTLTSKTHSTWKFVWSWTTKNCRGINLQQLWISLFPQYLTRSRTKLAASYREVSSN